MNVKFVKFSVLVSIISSIFTPVAGPSPVLITVIVYVTVCPGITVSSASSSYIYKQPARNKSFRILHTTLNPSEISCGCGQFQDTHRIDIGPGDL